MIQQRLHDAPGFFDAVLASEQLMVADEGGVQHPLVGFPWFAQFLTKQRVQVHRALRIIGTRDDLQPQTGVRIDAQHDLVGIDLCRFG